MTNIIPRNLIKHLEWTPATGSPPPGNTGTTPPARGTSLIYPRHVIDNPQSYIQVPQYQGLVIATAETHKGLNMFDTLEALVTEQLYMPPVPHFMRHRLNLKEAGLDKTRKLLYADETEVAEDVAVDLWKYVSSGHRKGCWTWLNSQFKEEGGIWYIENNLTVATDSDGKKSLIGERQPLDCSIREDCYVNFDANEQGFPTSKAPTQKYEADNNNYFYHPRNGAVARFLAASDRSDLDCGGNPDVRYSSLGVFACAAGGAPQNRGGTL